MFHWASQKPNTTGPPWQLCIFDLLLPSTQLPPTLTCTDNTFCTGSQQQTAGRSQSKLSITSSTNPLDVTSRDAITGNCWHHITTPHPIHRGTGDRAHAANVTGGLAMGGGLPVIHPWKSNQGFDFDRSLSWNRAMVHRFNEDDVALISTSSAGVRARFLVSLQLCWSQRNQRATPTAAAGLSEQSRQGRKSQRL